MTIVMLIFSGTFNGEQIANVPDSLFVGTGQYAYLAFSAMCLTGVFFSYYRGDLRK
jgi:hypothetical protein